jgi:hypothetical protein
MAISHARYRDSVRRVLYEHILPSRGKLLQTVSGDDPGS